MHYTMDHKNFYVTKLSYIVLGVDSVFYYIAESLVKVSTEELAEFTNDHFSSKTRQDISDSSENPNPSNGSIVSPSISSEQRSWKKTCCWFSMQIFHCLLRFECKLWFCRYEILIFRDYSKSILISLGYKHKHKSWVLGVTTPPDFGMGGSWGLH